MCDYSLEEYASRNAVKEDDLTLQTFESGSRGFVATDGDPEYAVCLQPGTRLNVTRNGVATTAIFVQPDKKPAGHRDCLLFAGTNDPLSLQTLEDGTRAVVVALAGETLPRDEEDPEHIPEEEDVAPATAGQELELIRA